MPNLKYNYAMEIYATLKNKDVGCLILILPGCKINEYQSRIAHFWFQFSVYHNFFLKSIKKYKHHSPEKLTSIIHSRENHLIYLIWSFLHQNLSALFKLGVCDHHNFSFIFGPQLTGKEDAVTVFPETGTRRRSSRPTNLKSPMELPRPNGDYLDFPQIHGRSSLIDFPSAHGMNLNDLNRVMASHFSFHSPHALLVFLSTARKHTKTQKMKPNGMP